MAQDSLYGIKNTFAPTATSGRGKVWVPVQHNGTCWLKIWTAADLCDFHLRLLPEPLPISWAYRIPPATDKLFALHAIVNIRSPERFLLASHPGKCLIE